jgi:hypothetical protein
MGFFKNMITAFGIGAASVGAANAETPKGIEDLLVDDTKIEAPKLELKKAVVSMPDEKSDEQITAEYEAENARIRAHNEAVRAAMGKKTNYEIAGVREAIDKMKNSGSSESSSDVVMKK